MKMPPRTPQYVLLALFATGGAVSGYGAIQAVMSPGPTDIMEIWKASGLAGLALACTICCLWIIRWLVGEVLNLAKQQATYTAQLNGQIAALIAELRERTVPSHQQQTPLGKHLLDSTHDGCKM